eukprot:jgi/Botrbrau1/3004/Bobra.0070s0003.1
MDHRCSRINIFVFILSIICLQWVPANGRHVDAANHPVQSTAWAHAWLQTTYNHIFASKRGDQEPEPDCEAEMYRKDAMTLLYETSFSALFSDLHGQTKFEASGVEFVNGTYYTAFDSLEAVGVTPERLSRLTSDNLLIGDFSQKDSQFEGISKLPKHDSLLLVREAIEPKEGEGFRAQIVQIALPAPSASSKYTIEEECEMDVYFESDNKGIEDINAIFGGGGGTDNEEGVYVLSLCEGNHCEGGKRGREKGNGRIAVTQRVQGTGPCKYTCVKMINIPGEEDEAYFTGLFGNGYPVGTRRVLRPHDRKPGGFQSVVWTLRQAQSGNRGDAGGVPLSAIRDMPAAVLQHRGHCLDGRSAHCGDL